MTASSSNSTDPYRVRPGALRGRLTVPPSKSVTQRLLNLALLAGEPVTVEGPLVAEDTRLFLTALMLCGWEVEETEPAVELRPGAPRGDRAELFCGNAGTLLRFLLASLTTLPGEWFLDGTSRLRVRPVGPLVGALRRLGARIDCLEEEGFAPLRVQGASLRGGRASLAAGESSQYLSALLMAGLRAAEPVEIEVASLTSAPYVELTIETIGRFGGEVARPREGSYRVEPTRLQGGSHRVEGDYSAACYPAAGACLTGGRVVLRGLDPGSRQGDRGFLELLGAMGAEVRWREDGVEVAGTGRLRSIDADLSTMPDQAPTLAALAPFAAGVTRIRNVPHLRHKESDRLAAVAEELGKLGAEASELPHGLEIPGVWAGAPPPTEEVVVGTHGDHRIAMSMALVGLRRSGVSIAEPEVVAKSYPGFWRDLEGLRGS